MNGFRTLVWSEWRAQRAFLLFVALVLPPLAWAEQRWIGDHYDLGNWTAFGALGLWGLFVAIVASDLVSGELRERVSETYAWLPSSPTARWCAKVQFLAGAALVVGVLSLSIHALTLGLARDAEAAAQLVQGLAETWPVAIVGLIFASIALFASTLGLPGVSALALAALATAGSVLATPLVVETLELAFARSVPSAWVAASGAAYAGLFGLGSWVAFAFGRPDLGHRRRTVVLGIATVTVPVGLVALGVGASIQRARSIDPTSPRASIVRMSPAPDGRRLALQLEHAEIETIQRVACLDLESGRTIVAPGGFVTHRGWTRSGELLLQRPAEGGLVAFDPKTEVERPCTDPDEIAGDRSRDWARVAYEGDTWSLEWIERGLTVSVESFPFRQSSAGLFLLRSERDELLVHDLRESTEPQAFPARGVRWVSALSVTDDESRILLRLRDGFAVLDFRTGKVVAGPWDVDYARWLPGDARGRFVVCTETPRSARSVVGRLEQVVRLVDVETGADVPLGSVAGFTSVQALDAERLVVMRHPGDVELVDFDGRRLRTLFER